jgi:ribosomal protein L11 methyltransferase
VSSGLTWFAVTIVPQSTGLSSDDFDGLCAELIELGASGTAVDRAPQITCYLEGAPARLDTFLKGLSQLPCDVISVSQVKEENWTGACPEVWEPIIAGGFEVVPVESLNDERSTSPGTIRIIPGLGFGTGHHSTTRMVLTALSSYRPPALEGRRLRVFDLGTGSGILAIAAAKAFGVPVEGNDIDVGALDNARDNIALNSVSHLVTVSMTPLEEIEAGYDLVLANVYGEVLMKLAPELTRIARPGATAILSGITEIVWEQVWQVYGEQFGWQLISELSDSGWMCAVLQRPTT